MAIRIAIMAAAWLIAAVCFLAVGAFLCIALYNGLQVALPQWAAALVTAGIILVFALLVLLFASVAAKTASRKAEEDREAKSPEISRIGLEIGKILGETAYHYVSRNPKRVLVGALVAGFAVGAVPRLRSVLMSFLKKR